MTICLPLRHYSHIMNDHTFNKFRLLYTSSRLCQSRTDYIDSFDYLFNDTIMDISGEYYSRVEHIARLTTLLSKLLIMFVEDIFAMRLWSDTMHIFRALIGREIHNDIIVLTYEQEYDLLCGVLLSWRNEKHWNPIIHAIYLFGGDSLSALQAQQNCNHRERVRDLIIHGDYRALLLATFDDIKYVAHVRDDALRSQELGEIIDKIEIMANDFQNASGHLTQFATLIIIRSIFSEYVDSDDYDYVPLKNIARTFMIIVRSWCTRISQWNIHGKINCVACVLICQLYERDATAPARERLVSRKFIKYIVNRAREFIGYISIDDEIDIINTLNTSPIRAININDNCATESITYSRPINQNVFLGFNGICNIIAYGPISFKEAITCVNIANICSYLNVPRDNGNSRIITDPEFNRIYFIADTDIKKKYDLHPTVKQIIAKCSKNSDALRGFIKNCLWRDIMNFPIHSFATGIIVDDGDAIKIYAYGEQKICGPKINIAASAQTDASNKSPPRVRRDILRIFARDIEHYRQCINEWIAKLTSIANIEHIARTVYDKYARTDETGIVENVIDGARDRAVRVIDDWLQLLDNKSS